MNLLYRPYTHRNPSKDIFRSSLRSVFFLFPKGLNDRQSYVLSFCNVDRWAKARSMLRYVRESIVVLAEEITRKLQP